MGTTTAVQLKGHTMKRMSYLVASLVSSLVFADTRISTVEDVSFIAVGPAGFKINGKTNEISVVQEGDFYVLKVPMDTVKTGIDLRDSHMKEKYVETGKFPNAELKVPKSSLKEGGGQNVKGLFKVHGVEKEVAVNYSVSKDAGAMAVKGTFNINLKNHGIEVPSYLGVTVKPDVVVNANFKVNP